MEGGLCLAAWQPGPISRSGISYDISYSFGLGASVVLHADVKAEGKFGGILFAAGWIGARVLLVEFTILTPLDFFLLFSDLGLEQLSKCCCTS